MENLFTQHAYTTAREAPRRCFDVCYVSVILEVLFGEDMHHGKVHFLAEVRIL